jgi:hypothetical protein
MLERSPAGPCIPDWTLPGLPQQHGAFGGPTEADDARRRP